MSLLDRRATVWLNFCLDNLLPSFLRDSKLLMWPLMRLVLGPMWREFANFKGRASYLSSKELTEIYQRLASSHLPRETDLHPSCVRLICDRVVGDKILDVGCGRGYLTGLLDRVAGRKVVGLDINPPKGPFEGQLTYCCGQVSLLPFADSVFDTVICAHTLEHVVDLRSAIRELRRVAKRRLIIIVPRQRPYLFTFDLHLHFFPYPYLLDLLMGAPVPTCKIVGGDLYYEEEIHLR